jgi:hypothetical protein
LAYTTSYIHLHPQYKLIKDVNWQIAKGKMKIADIICINSAYENKYKGDEVNGWYSPEFGMKHENNVLEIYSQAIISGYIINFSNYPVEAQCYNDKVTVRYNGTIKQVSIK